MFYDFPLVNNMQFQKTLESIRAAPTAKRVDKEEDQEEEEEEEEQPSPSVRMLKENDDRVC